MFKVVTMSIHPSFLRLLIMWINRLSQADNHLIELAIAGNAQIIATKNIKDFLNSDLIFPSLAILKLEQIIRR